MWKKTVALALVLVLAVSMCACDLAGSVQDVVEDVLPVVQSFVAGTVEDNRYENTFAGVACQLDENWTFLDEDQIRELNGIATEIMGEEYQKALENAALLQDMQATHANQMDSVNVNFEKLPILRADITEQEYAEAGAAGSAAALESMGFENMTYEVGTIQFAGSEHAAIRLQGTYMGIAVYETLALYKCEGYMMVVTACSWQENTTEEILANFTAI